MQAKKGDKVSIYYTGYLTDGTVFASTGKEEPLTFVIGHHSVLPILEDSVVGMQPGVTKSVSIPPEHAYGHHNTDLVSVVDRSKVPEGIRLKTGMKLRARTKAGIIKEVRVRDVSEDSVTVDANHPLAGKVLTFEIKLLDIC